MTWRSPSFCRYLLAFPAGVFLLVACVDDSATPIDPSQPNVTMNVDDMDFTDVTHTMEPTPEMREAAESQCLEDPERVEGYVRAVDPETGEVFAEITVDCADVRG